MVVRPPAGGIGTMVVKWVNEVLPTYGLKAVATAFCDENRPEGRWQA